MLAGLLFFCAGLIECGPRQLDQDCQLLLHVLLFVALVHSLHAYTMFYRQHRRVWYAS